MRTNVRVTTPWEALASVTANQRIWGWGLPAEDAGVDKRAHLADRQLQAALRARDLAPLDSRVQFFVAGGYYATCQPERVLVEAEKAAALSPYDAGTLGGLGLWVAFTGHWDEGNALAEKAIKLAGPSAVPYWWWPKAKRAWFRGEYQEAYEAFQRAYIKSFWLSHLDLACTLPFLGRVDEAKQHVAALLKMYPTMTIREADAFYKLVCFDAALSREDGRRSPPSRAARVEPLSPNRDVRRCNPERPLHVDLRRRFCANTDIRRQRGEQGKSTRAGIRHWLVWLPSARPHSTVRPHG